MLLKANLKYIVTRCFKISAEMIITYSDDGQVVL